MQNILSDDNSLFGENLNISYTEGNPRFEICRILIWDEEDLLDGNTKLLIDMYNYFNIPLFYLDPKKLEGASTWKDNEYLFIHEEPDLDSVKPAGVKGLWISKKNQMEQDEPLSNGKLSTNKKAGYVAEHFKVLLANPDIIFARDARSALDSTE